MAGPHRGRRRTRRDGRVHRADPRRVRLRSPARRTCRATSSGAGTLLANLRPAMTPNPFIKQYLMTAGPTPVPPAVLPGDGRAGALPPRAGVRRALRARAGAPAAVFQTSNDVLVFAASGSGAMESAVANLVRPGTARARLRRRQVRRALDRALRGLRRRPRRATSRAGASGWTRPRSTACSTKRRHRGRLRHAVSETSTGIVHDVQAIAEVVARARRHPRRRRGLRPRRRRAAPGRVGRRRRRRRLAEGADVPARPRASPPSPSARSTYAAAAARRPLLLRLGQDRQEPAQGRGQPVHARRSACSAASTSRST